MAAYRYSYIRELEEKTARLEKEAQLYEQKQSKMLSQIEFKDQMIDALTKQDCLYGLLLRGNTSACARVVGSIVDFVFVPEDPEASLKRLCSPSVKIISLTVTEKGYYRTVSGELDVSNALVKEDIDGFGAAGLAPFVGEPAC